MEREEIIKDIEKLYQAQAERDLHEIDYEEFNNITFETKLAEYIIAEIEKARKEAYADALYQYRRNKKRIDYTNFLKTKSEV